jgi:hypothetical protein
MLPDGVKVSGRPVNGVTPGDDSAVQRAIGDLATALVSDHTFHDDTLGLPVTLRHCSTFSDYYKRTNK